MGPADEMKRTKIPIILATVHFFAVLVVVYLSSRAGKGNEGLFIFDVIDLPVSVISGIIVQFLIKINPPSTSGSFIFYNWIVTILFLILGSIWIYFLANAGCKILKKIYPPSK